MMGAVHPRLGEMLVKEGACSEAAVRDALKNQIIFGGRLGTNLLEIKAVSEEALARTLGRQHALPSLFGDLQLDEHATALLTAEIADRCDAIPYVLADRRLAVIVIDPRNLTMLDEVAFATGKQVHPIVAPEARVWALLRQRYAIDRHLRGIDVDFAEVQGRIDHARGLRPDAPEDGKRGSTPGDADLIDQGAFEAIYGAPGKPMPAPPPGSPRAPPSVAPPPDNVAEPSPLSFAEASRFLEGVDERDAIAKTVLRYARSKFKRALLLTIDRDAAHGWAGLGEKLGAHAVRRMHLALGTPGILETVVVTRAHFLGPIPKTDANIRLLKALGGGVPANAFVVPILALGRIVNVFYADNGKGGVVDSGDVGELLILATRIAKSYDALLERVR
jgi:hypothetical protein